MTLDRNPSWKILPDQIFKDIFAYFTISFFDLYIIQTWCSTMNKTAWKFYHFFFRYIKRLSNVINIPFIYYSKSWNCCVVFKISFWLCFGGICNFRLRRVLKSSKFTIKWIKLFISIHSTKFMVVYYV